MNNIRETLRENGTEAIIGIILIIVFALIGC